jgi:large subunit ribosomal protein L28
MARVCQITGKRTESGNKVSHANNKTLRKFYPNIHTKKFYLESQRMWVTLKVSTRGIKTINKLGLEAALNDAHSKGHLVRVK